MCRHYEGGREGGREGLSGSTKYTEGEIGKADRAVRWILQHLEASDDSVIALHHHGSAWVYDTQQGNRSD